MWQEFMGILQQMVSIYEELETLGRKKREHLVVLNLAALDKILEKENVCARKIAGLEKERQKVFLKLACAEKRLRPDMKMRDMLDLVPADLQERFSSLQEALTSAVDRVKKDEKETSLLVHGALDAVNIQLNRIGGTRVEPAYGSSGQDVVSHRKNFEFRA